MAQVSFRSSTIAAFVLFAGIACAADKPARLQPRKLARIGAVDKRYQSFNVEMVEVTGGRFWAPYNSQKPANEGPKLATPGLDPSLFRMRAPIDLSNARLRKLAAALGPSYMRVSGTWANSAYFHDSDDPPPATPPEGFGGILTRSEWKGVIDFSHAVDALIVTSFAITAGVRNAEGVWTDDQACKLMAFTKASGGSIAAAEMFNEPSFAAMGGAPKGYDAAAYGHDFIAFKAFAKKCAPDMTILGPGSVGETTKLAPFPIIKSEDMLKAGGHGIDAFSYHFYGGVSKRCGSAGMPGQTTLDAAMTDEWLSLTDKEVAFYSQLRDKYEPGKPLWLTETGETACGGNPWASTFIDSFRYLNQLGALARHGVQVVAHNTLAASDYALLDENTLNPRPNYWSAYLWHKLMGETVLDASAANAPHLHVYAHCKPGQAGGVTILAINADRDGPHQLNLAAQSERFTLSADNLTSATVKLNGMEMNVGADDSLPEFQGISTPPGNVDLPPASITFFTVPNAKNASCK